MLVHLFSGEPYSPGECGTLQEGKSYPKGKHGITEEGVSFY